MESRYRKRKGGKREQVIEKTQYQIKEEGNRKQIGQLGEFMYVPSS